MQFSAICRYLDRSLGYLRDLRLFIVGVVSLVAVWIRVALCAGLAGPLVECYMSQYIKKIRKFGDLLKEIARVLFLIRFIYHMAIDQIFPLIFYSKRKLLTLCSGYGIMSFPRVLKNTSIFRQMSLDL